MTSRGDEHSSDRGTKKLLALDGGGIRGLISLEVLRRIERLVRDSSGDEDAVLGDYFDYIGGTSTGAIIAAGLALGFDVDRLLALYEQQGAAMFAPARFYDRHRHAYDEDPLESILKAELGADTTLGSDRLRCLLLIVLRNASTDSPWPLSSNPRALFNEPQLPDCNLHLPLWKLVRASTAAPTFFAPEEVRVGDNEFVFVDGGLTPFNDPALQLFLMATLDEYRLGWPTGEQNLLLVSVGTGNSEHARPGLEADDMHLLHHAKATPGALMISAAAQQDMLCRVLGRCRHGDPVDSEVGDLRSSHGLFDERLFTYVRYDRALTPTTLGRMGLNDISLGEVLPIDAVDHMGDLRRIGTAIADEQFDPNHFDSFLGR